MGIAEPLTLPNGVTLANPTLGHTGKIDEDVLVVEGNERYIADIASATDRHLRARTRQD